jgi:hypothetical protein
MKVYEIMDVKGGTSRQHWPKKIGMPIIENINL